MTRVLGEDHGAAKLTEVDVRTARALVRLGHDLDLVGAVVFARTGHRVSRSALSMAITGRTWSHVPGALHPKTPRESARRPRRRRNA